jgi:hypothetical protein
MLILNWKYLQIDALKNIYYLTKLDPIKLQTKHKIGYFHLQFSI